MLQEHRVEKLLVVNDLGNLTGLITVKDILKKQNFPNAAIDKHGRLLVGAAVGIDEDTLDRVGELINNATERGRKQKKTLKLGICGEHGGDPASVEFCEKAKLNYVSCSPYRVPIARLSAAQAYLKKK